MPNFDSCLEVSKLHVFVLTKRFFGSLMLPRKYDSEVAPTWQRTVAGTAQRNGPLTRLTKPKPWVQGVADALQGGLTRLRAADGRTPRGLTCHNNGPPKPPRGLPDSVCSSSRPESHNRQPVTRGATFGKFLNLGKFRNCWKQATPNRPASP